ncbi:MAG TPA: sulfatase-like hydrolase/transferase [Solirubrobacteraceae bacterium]|nr:sulfatase-like hydrolase/transferase [Solirubrobacteraceae bacterium]
MPLNPTDIHAAGADAASDRRTFLKQGLLAAGGLALGAHRRSGGTHPASRRHTRQPPGGRAPNILVIVVDQLRTPAWMPAAASTAALMPNLASLRAGAVSFERHYTASNDCSPSRGALVTGLYSHQTGCLITGNSRLDPGFPTWGTLLRELDYSTWWWGKWHLNPNPDTSLEQYGFSGGTYPSPNGSPGQGTAVDPEIAAQFIEWLAAEGANQPWCATVSFVNPHDIAWWYRFTERILAESSPPALADALPPNFETPEALEAQRKPQLQRSLQDTSARSFGEVPFTGAEAITAFTGLMNTYLMLQNYVDAQIGAVLSALAAQPAVQANTVVVFTSDHGEYGGSHGMRGKGASAYEEAIRVPLYVRDHRGLATAAPALGRTQLTSSVDVVPLLLTLATGSSRWRAEARYRHLAHRHNLAAICANPSAPGRPWVLHATDEDVTEFAVEPYAASAPRHVVALRTQRGKLALYSNWRASSVTVEPAGQEFELYDYSTSGGQLELANTAGAAGALEEELWVTLEEQALPGDLRAPLPPALRAAQRRGLANYVDVEEFETYKAYTAHVREAETAPTPD